MEQVVFKDDNMSLCIGDVVALKHPTCDGFYSSHVGAKFKSEVCDEVRLEVKQYDWLEVYFTVTLYKNNKVLLDKDIYPEDVDGTDQDSRVFSEAGDYNFLRYLISNGAKKH